MAALLLGVCFTSCNKDEYTATPATSNVNGNGTAYTTSVNGNPGTTSAVSPEGETTNPSSTSYGWKWNSADVYIGNVFVKTVKDGDQAQAQTVELNGRYSILPNPVVLPVPVLTTGTYTRIDVSANVQNTATGALTINGVLGPGAPGLPVVIRVEEPMQLLYNAMNKVIGANEKYRLAIRINVTALNNTLNDQDAANARVAGGPIEISKNQNAELYNKIMQNIKNIVIIDLVRS